MASLHHIPTNLIVSVLMNNLTSYLEPLAHIHWELTYSGVNPTCGPLILTMAWIDLVILVLHINVHLFLWKTINCNVWSVSSCC